KIAPGAQDLLMAMLCETGRFFLKPAAPPDALLPLRWDAGPPWRFSIAVHRNGGKTEYIVSGVLVRDASQIPVSEPLLLVAGLAFFRDHVTRFDDGGAFRWVRMLRDAETLRVPIGQRSEFLREISRFP